MAFDSAFAGIGTGGFLAGGGIALEVSVLFAGSELADTSLGYKH